MLSDYNAYHTFCFFLCSTFSFCKIELKSNLLWCNCPSSMLMYSECMQGPSYSWAQTQTYWHKNRRANQLMLLDELSSGLLMQSDGLLRCGWVTQVRETCSDYINFIFSRWGSGVHLGGWTSPRSPGRTAWTSPTRFPTARWSSPPYW